MTEWDDLLAKVEAIEKRIEPYRNADGGMTTPVPRRADVAFLASSLRHAINYARDAESGNAVLRKQVERGSEMKP